MENALDLEARIELEPGAPVPLSGDLEILAIAAADLDGDGDTDFTLGTRTKNAAPARGLQILLNNGPGLFAASHIDLEFSPLAIVTADFDRDRDVDIAVSIDTQSIGLQGVFVVFLNRGDGQFDSPRTFGEGLGSAGGGRASSFLAADLNKDGYADLALSSTSQVKVFLNDGEAGFEYGSLVDAVEPGGSVGSISAADMDADGDIDLLTSNSARFLLNNGDATFQILKFALPVATTGALIATNMDGDGDLDLVGKGTYVHVFRNLRNLTFPFAASFEPVGPSAVSVLDIDGDEDSDIAALTTVSVSSTTRGQITLLANDGHGMLREGATMLLPVNSDIRTLLQGDFDGDGKMDLAAPDFRSNSIEIVLNRSKAAVSLDENRDGIPDDCERPKFHRGDPNEDGSIDLTDALVILKHLFGPNANPMQCLPANDANDDNSLNVTDAVYVMSYLFRGGPAPPLPGPPDQPCGEDPTPPATGHRPCIYTSCVGQE